MGRAERLQVRVLDEVLGIRRAPGQTQGRPVQAVDMGQRRLRELRRRRRTRRREEDGGKMPDARRPRENTGGGAGLFRSLYRGEDTGRSRRGTVEGGGRPHPRASSRSAGGTWLAAARRTGVSAGDPGVAANVLVTVTSAPFEVYTCVRAAGAVYERRSASPSFLFVFVAGTIAASAQTPFVPYYNKNRIKYDHFKWHTYTTDHFEIYYYPEIEQHLERVASYAESAYQQVSADLKHDLAFKVPLILYKTASEFQQQNIEPGELPEGVLAFAEPYRDRMVLPIDEPSDALYRLITHELTHIFEFDIIPRTLLRRGLPLWVDEGLSDYKTGYWNPFDLMSVRDAAIADIVPPMSDFQGVQFADGRLPYNLGHAAFEFIESKWGKEGLRQFLFALRKSVIGGGDSAYEEAFKLKPDEFDEQFDKYLKDRFKPFRDKERPQDYGRDLAPEARQDRTTCRSSRSSRRPRAT